MRPRPIAPKERRIDCREWILPPCGSNQAEAKRLSCYLPHDPAPHPSAPPTSNKRVLGAFYGPRKSSNLLPPIVSSVGVPAAFAQRTFLGSVGIVQQLFSSLQLPYPTPHHTGVYTAKLRRILRCRRVFLNSLYFSLLAFNSGTRLSPQGNNTPPDENVLG